MRTGRWPSEVEPWLLIDPTFADMRARRVAEAVLSMVTSGWSEVTPIDPSDPTTRSVLLKHRIAGAVPADAVPDEQRQSFIEELQNAQVTQMRIQATGREVCAALTAAGIDHRVLKGLATAFLDYPTPELRLTGDVDIAVPTNAIDESLRVLRGLDFEALPGVPIRAEHAMKGFTVRSALGIEVDVHNRLFTRPGEPDALFAQPGADLPEVASSALPLEGRLVHAAGHLLETPPGIRRMSGLVDLVLLLDQNPDPERTLSWAQATGAGDVVAAALRIEAALTGRPLMPLEGWPKMPMWQRYITLSTERRWAAEYLDRMLALPWRHRLEYLPTWVTPRRPALRKAINDLRRRTR